MDLFYEKEIQAKNKQDDNYCMLFLEDNLNCAYKKLKESWIGIYVKLEKNNLYFDCALNKLAYFFFIHGGITGIYYIIKRMYIYKPIENKYYPINKDSFKSTYSYISRYYSSHEKVKISEDRYRI